MLYRLSIQNRTPGELRQLASERRELAGSKDGHLKRLLLNEAKQLEFYLEFRSWMDRTAAHQAGERAQAARQAVPKSIDLSPLLETLSHRMGLSVDDQQALLPTAQARWLTKGEMIVDQEERSAPFLLLCSGAVRATRTLEDGSQQIVSVFLPGDPLNSGDFVLGFSLTSISTFTSALVLSIPAAELRMLFEQRPAIMRAMWRETALQASIQREWMIWLGRKTAEARLAHFLCEVAYRMQAGKKEFDEFEFPLTQGELADILGLSTVHVNRVLQQLRSKKLVELSQGRLSIRNRPGLYEAAEFDPRYLEVANTTQSSVATGAR
jgi:CRP-like cAMP-binding protein